MSDSYNTRDAVAACWASVSIGMDKKSILSLIIPSADLHEPTKLLHVLACVAHVVCLDFPTLVNLSDYLRSGIRRPRSTSCVIITCSISFRGKKLKVRSKFPTAASG